MTTDLPQSVSPLPHVGSCKQCFRVTGRVLAVLVVLMMNGCSDDEPERHTDRQADTPRQTIVVQIPASQWPPQQVQQPVAPLPVQQPRPPAADGNNPWAVPRRPRSNGQHRFRQWGQPRPERPQYVQPSAGSRYRPLEPQQERPARAPVARQPVQPYRPVAPYDRLSGSSFGTPAYPYGSAYPGYYGQGGYALPGNVYGPGWPGYW